MAQVAAPVWIDQAAVVAKFRDNAALALPDAQAARVIELVDALATQPAVGPLMDALTA